MVDSLSFWVLLCQKTQKVCDLIFSKLCNYIALDILPPNALIKIINYGLDCQNKTSKHECGINNTHHMMVSYQHGTKWWKPEGQVET